MLYSFSWITFCFLGRILDYMIEPASISLPLSSPNKTNLTHVACGRAHLVVATDKEGGEEQLLRWRLQIGLNDVENSLVGAVKSNSMQMCACFLWIKLWLLEEIEKELQTENFLNISNIVFLVISVLSLEPLKIEMCCSICVNDIGN